MFYWASKIIGIVIQPSHFLLLLLLLAVVLLILGYVQLGRFVGAVFAVLIVIIWLTPAPYWAVAQLEDRFQKPDPMPEKVTGIIVLGGSTRDFVSHARQEPNLSEHGERVIHGYILSKRYPDARLVATGGSGLMIKPPLLEAEITKDLWLELGADADAIELEDQSRNTHENAMFTKAMVDPQPGETWLLVTSAFHMPRSVGIFREQDFPVIPYPVDYYSVGSQVSWVAADFSRSLKVTDKLAHEFYGLVAYWLSGKTSSLFPAPDEDK